MASHHVDAIAKQRPIAVVRLPIRPADTGPGSGDRHRGSHSDRTHAAQRRTLFPGNDFHAGNSRL